MCEDIKICKECGIKIEWRPLIAKGITTGDICSVGCYEKYMKRPEQLARIKKSKEDKQNKHEEIKQKAWEIYQRMQLLTDELFFKDSDNKNTRFKDFHSENNIPMLNIAWSRAARFYDFAKEQEEAGDDETKL